MLFSIEVRDQKLPSIQPRVYNECEDDLMAMFIDICEVLADTGAADFRVSGFGQDPWPVDVRTDLPVLLEQLPTAIAASAEPTSGFILDFYEQGIERRLVFIPSNQEFTVTCESDTDWRPEPAQENIEVTFLRRQLVTLKNNFLRVVRVMAPEVDAHKLFREWASEADSE